MKELNFCKRQRETIAIVADTVDRVQRSFKESVLLDELMRQDKLNRVKNKITTHEKADSSFDETILGLLDIATQAGYVFERSSNVDLKRLLLKFVFENITLTEGGISYKLRFPFNEFIKVNNPDDNKPLPYEPMESLSDKGVEANDNENIQSGYMQFCEPKIMLKKQEVALENATSLSSGWSELAVCEMKIVFNKYKGFI